MTPYQYQQYSFLEQQRKRAMYNYSLVQNALSILRKAIHDGKDPRTDPDLNKYWILIDENNKELLISEMNDLFLTLEKDTEFNG